MTQSTRSIWASRCANHRVDERCITVRPAAGPRGGLPAAGRGSSWSLPRDLERLRLAGRVQQPPLAVPLVAGLFEEVPRRLDVARILGKAAGVAVLERLAHGRVGHPPEPL